MLFINTKFNNRTVYNTKYISSFTKPIMAYPATIIALAFVKKGIEEGNFVTQMKLQKLVYFAHGYHLAKYKEPLIKEEFQAWQFGPVIPKIYQEYKYYGSNPITDPSLIGWLYDIDKSDTNKLDQKAQSSIDYTWRALKDLSGYQLSNWSSQIKFTMEQSLPRRRSSYSDS